MNGKGTRIQRATDALLVMIVLSVGLMAGAASFHHVHDWTLRNSPAGTADWFGWANAVITELIPTAALIIIAQRRKTGGHTRYPMFLLIAAVGVSLTAQLAVAVPTVFGWMVSALPALAFFALSKLVFATSKTPEVAPVAEPEPVETSQSLEDWLRVNTTAPESHREPLGLVDVDQATTEPMRAPSEAVARSKAAVAFLRAAKEADSESARAFYLSKYEAEIAASAA